MRTMHDPEAGVRVGVIKAIEQAIPYDVELVLRAAIRCGDPETEVTAQAFSSLMKVAPVASLDFVARYLDASEDDIVEAAAIASRKGVPLSDLANDLLKREIAILESVK